MPQLNGLSVHVLSEGNELDEWGIQRLRKSKKVSSYIQSNTNQEFQVSIQPQLPWQESQKDLLKLRRSSRRTKSSSVAGDFNSMSTAAVQCDNDSMSSPVHPLDSSSDLVPEYSLIAELYLDGRERPERRSLVYLDPSHKDFAEDGKVIMKHRWIRDRDGNLREHKWVFKEKGIETVLNTLDLNCPDKADGDDEDMLSKALATSGIVNGITEQIESHNAAGQIVIILKRIILGASYVDPHHRFLSRTSSGEDTEMGEAGKEVTHITSLIGNHVVVKDPMRVIDISPYDPDEGDFAVFQFFYRSCEGLARMGFEGFPQMVREPSGNVRRLSSQIANLTPLSFQNTKTQVVGTEKEKSLCLGVSVVN